ncbi:MAG: 16S rRNA (cytosine(967)-C(5))-methyltransferase RsmB [Arenimonas sp.]|nr:16S rRNA (cytosine(967)-C(5))-methyltransferase RsmB [Arenimonas sp.]
MNNPGANLRAVAAQVIAHVLYEGRSLKAELGNARIEFTDSRDKALLEAICFDVIRQRRSLEFALSKFLQKSVQRQDPVLHCLLLVGLAQLHHLKLSEHAAVSSSVDAARLLGKHSRAGMLNAVLRRSLREGLTVSADSAVQCNHPDWLIKQIQTDWPDHWQAIMQANNEQAPLWIRVNDTKISREKYSVMLDEAQIKYSVPDFVTQAICLDQSIAPTRLPGWQEGLFAVQDVSAQLAVQALAVKSGMTVLDMCAAPGGKSAQLAQSGLSKLVLLELYENRLSKIIDLFERLQLSTENVHFETGDAALPLPEHLPQQFDAILLDAPCSATGIIRRQPDVKWHRQPKDIDHINTLQWRLLKNAWRHLKPGGRLLYSTCSILKSENSALLDSFLKQNPDATALPLEETFGKVSGIGRQRFPGENAGDGFFYALLERTRAK